MVMPMSTDSALYKLQSWLSPSYPVGAYSFSHGIENAVERSLVATASDAADWIEDIICRGNGFADLVFLSASWEASGDVARLSTVIEEAFAFQTTAELRGETTAQGAAFVTVTADAWPCDAFDTLRDATRGPCPYPVAVGAVAAGHGIDKTDTLTAYGHAFVSNLVSAAIRLIPLGQTDGQRIIARLQSSVNRSVVRALNTPLDRVATSTLMVDITSMNHETQYTRLFRS